MIRATLLLALSSVPAFAQDRPASMPARDVDVTYRSELGGQVIEQRSRFAPTLQRMRLDMPTPGLYAITDYRARTMSIVSDPERGVIDMPTAPAAQPGVAPGPYTRRGEDRVAGLPCTEWETRDSQGQPALTCFTEDGVLLRARRGNQVLAVATRVSYGAMDPALFTIPPAYQHVRRAPP